MANILTACDSAFFKFLPGLARSVEKRYSKRLIVYDFGMTDEQAASVPIERVVAYDDGEWRKMVHYTRGPEQQKCQAIRTTHKPACIKDYFESHNEPLIYVDADCIFRQKVEMEGFDLGVTLKPREDRYAEGDHYSSYLNAGVMFWNRPTAMLDEWAHRCQDENTTDQKAMTDMVAEVADYDDPNVMAKLYKRGDTIINILPTSLFNDYHLKSGFIFHFKGEKQKVYDEWIRKEGM